MDISVEYIKMCAKATEIQKLRGKGLWQPGDFLVCGCAYCVNNTMIQIIPTTINGRNHIVPELHPITDAHAIWLPRQDQLQPLVGGYNAQMFLLNLFIEDNNDLSFEWPVLSMEQLWLSLVMCQKCNNFWTGKEWKVKE